MPLSGGGSKTACDVVGNVGVEKLEQSLANGTWSGNVVAGDLAHADQIAVRRSDENFFRGIKILRAQRLLDNRESRFGRNFQKNASRDAFQAAGTERRGI